jgi:cobalt-zinc-cadmium efflux system outer membrane protein
MKTLSFVFLFVGSAAALPAAEVGPSGVALEPLVAEIVAQHPERAFYAAEIEAAKAGRNAAGSRPDPELAFEVGRKRVRDAGGALRGEGAAWSVSLRQTFDWPGRLALRKAIANRQIEFAELGLARFERALAARARTLAYGLYAGHARALAVREVADRFATLKETFLAREPAGITPLLETRVIEAGELVLQRRAVAAELALQAALIELNLLRGAAAAAPLRIAAATLRFQDAPPVAELLVAALEQNFDFKMKRVELEQHGAEVRLAQHERRPAISVGPYLAQERAGDRETTVGLGLSVPLPVGGRTRGAIEGAEARRRQAEAALEAARRELEREVVTAAQAFATRVGETRRWSADTADKFREAAALADRHYRLGAVPIATYVELQYSYLDAVEALLDTQREALEAGLRLQLLAGVDFNAVQVVP